MHEQHEGALRTRTLEVEIFNTRFTIRELENEAYLQALAAEVDARIHQLYVTSAQISPLRAAIMAAYMFADEAKRQHEQQVTEQVPSS